MYFNGHPSEIALHRYIYILQFRCTADSHECRTYVFLEMFYEDTLLCSLEQASLPSSNFAANFIDFSNLWIFELRFEPILRYIAHCILPHSKYLT